MSAWTKEILDFWFEKLAPKDWWNKNDKIDAQIRARFFGLWDEEQHKPSDIFLTSSSDALAATILFDQFPRNMFRDDRKSFSTDRLAQQIAERAVVKKFDLELNAQQRPFQYMPFMHAEDLRLQNQSVELFEKLGSNENFAANHHDVIKRFGRFPHRNEILGRKSSPEEIKAVAEGAAW